MTPQQFIDKYTADLEIAKRVYSDNALFFTKEERLKSIGKALAINAMLQDFKCVQEALINNIFDHIKHGDKQHQKWLKNELDKFIGK